MMMKPGAIYRSVVRLGIRLIAPVGTAIGVGFAGAVIVAIAGSFGFLKGFMAGIAAFLSRRKP